MGVEEGFGAGGEGESWVVGGGGRFEKGSETDADNVSGRGFGAAHGEGVVAFEGVDVEWSRMSWSYGRRWARGRWTFLRGSKAWQGHAFGMSTASRLRNFHHGPG